MEAGFSVRFFLRGGSSTSESDGPKRSFISSSSLESVLNGDGDVVGSGEDPTVVGVGGRTTKVVVVVVESVLIVMGCWGLVFICPSSWLRISLY